MKKVVGFVFIIFMLIFCVCMLTSCANGRQIDDKWVPPYGYANQDAKKVPNVKYEVSFGSVVVAIVFSETIIIPVYVVGWDLFQPAR